MQKPAMLLLRFQNFRSLCEVVFLQLYRLYSRTIEAAHVGGLSCVWIFLQTLQPSEKETRELRDHVIIAGFGRVGQIIAQLLSERLIPFVALDVSAERVQVNILASTC